MGRIRTAFTLIELLVVISIIALLIGLLLPALGAARGSARDMACLSNQRQIGVGLYGYAQEYKDLLPLCYFNDAGTITDWGVSIAAYMTQGGASDYASGGRDQASPGLQCPTAFIDGGRLHYGANMMIMPFFSGGQIAGGAYPLVQYKLSYMDRPTEILFVADGTQTTAPEPQQSRGDTYAALDGLDNYNANDARDYFESSDADNNDPIDPGPNADGPLAGDDARDLRWRHGNGDLTNGSDEGNVNVLFGDGHAASNARGLLLRRNVKADR